LSPRNTDPSAQGGIPRDWPILLGLTLMGLVIFFYRLGVPGLMDPDEGRYAEIAREIWVLKDWLTPHLNFLPYLEKPPLVYWLTALSFGGLGYSEFAARLPSALSALGGVLLAYSFGRALWGPGPAFFSAVILATCGGYVVLGRILTLDMTLALFLNLAVGLGYLAWSRGRRDLWAWAYLALGLGVLTKGPVAPVLAWLIWGIWALLKRQPLRPLLHPLGLLILAGMSLPWFAWTVWQYPDFFRFFLLEQHFGRYLTVAIHPQPFYYYGPILLGLMLPWSWLLPWALWQKRRGLDPDSLFLLVWAAVVLVFFSLSQGKLPPYILPALLPLSLLLGESLFALQRAEPRLPGNPGLKVSLLIWALAAWGLVLLYFWPPAFLARHLPRANIFWPYLPWLLVGLALAPTLALITRRLGVLFLTALLLSTLAPVAMERLSLQRSPRELGRIVESHWQPGAALVGVQLYSQGLSFYSGQIFHLVNFRTELDFGRHLDPGSGLFFSSPAELRAFVEARPVVFFYLKDHDLTGLEQGLPGEFRLLALHKDCLLASYKGK
jgi:4-amino-4-deoxy-L-arabinose transferase-like glycosyltransferase